MYQKRIKTYSSLGYVSYDPFSGDKPISFDTKSFFLQHEMYTPLLSSPGNAKKEIIISSPYLYPSTSTGRIISFLCKAIARGVRVRVNTNIPSLIKRQSAHKHVVEELKNSGIQVEMVEPSFQKFVLVDTSEVWFGNVSILGDVLSVERDGLIDKRSEERGMLHIFNKNVWDSLYKQCFVMR